MSRTATCSSWQASWISHMRLPEKKMMGNFRAHCCGSRFVSRCVFVFISPGHSLSKNTEVAQCPCSKQSARYLPVWLNLWYGEIESNQGLSSDIHQGHINHWDDLQLSSTLYVVRRGLSAFLDGYWHRIRINKGKNVFYWTKILDLCKWKAHPFLGCQY